MNENQPPPILPESAPAAPKTSALAIWSLVLGILCLICGFFSAIPAVICGHLALSRIKHSAEGLTGRGLAIAGLIIGYLCIAVSAVLIPMFILIAAPNFVKARDTAQQNACINNLRQIDGAVQQWALEHQKLPTDTPAWSDLTPYLKTPTLTCPAGGTYTLHTVAQPPTCSIPGHQLPAQ